MGKVIKLRSNVAVSESGFVHDPTTGESFSTNEVGKFILDLLKTHISQDEIVSHIILNYDISGELAERYIIEFISDLKQYGMLEQ